MMCCLKFLKGRLICLALDKLESLKDMSQQVKFNLLEEQQTHEWENITILPKHPHPTTLIQNLTNTTTVGNSDIKKN